MRHRKKRHHLADIEEVRKLWGDDAAEAARQHIVTDLKLEGWRESDPFPKDGDHYQRMGLFCTAHPFYAKNEAAVSALPHC